MLLLELFEIFCVVDESINLYFFMLDFILEI